MKKSVTTHIFWGGLFTLLNLMCIWGDYLLRTLCMCFSLFHSFLGFLLWRGPLTFHKDTQATMWREKYLGWGTEVFSNDQWENEASCQQPCECNHLASSSSSLSQAWETGGDLTVISWWTLSHKELGKSLPDSWLSET
jgi:hypothetical protein